MTATTEKSIHFSLLTSSFDFHSALHIMDHFFSCQQSQSFLHYFPNIPTELPQPFIEISSSSSYPPYYYPEATREFSATYESSSSLGSGRIFPASDTEKAEPHDVGKKVPAPQAPIEKKRKKCHRTLSSPQTTEIKAGKNRKQRVPLGELKRKRKRHENDEMEPPAGYVHVRARRGQATDSRSLAERVRREKISERMQMLQGLVPGCERVTGTALVLDEIINYVQSLQNQFELLSMKLASLPIMYSLCEDHGSCMNQQEVGRKTHEAIPNVIQADHIQPTSYESERNYSSMMDISSSFLLPGQGGPTTFSQVYPSSEALSDQTRSETAQTHSAFQDNESFIVQVDEQGQAFHYNQVEFNMYFSQ